MNRGWLCFTFKFTGVGVGNLSAVWLNLTSYSPLYYICIIPPFKINVRSKVTLGLHLYFMRKHLGQYFTSKFRRIWDLKT
jgi:hypothetical protein